MTLHKGFRKGTHILVILKDGSSMHGKFIDSKTHKLIMEDVWDESNIDVKFPEIEIPWNEIRATTIWKWR